MTDRCGLDPLGIARRFADVDGLIVFDDVDARCGRPGRGAGASVVVADPVIGGRVDRVTYGSDPFAGCRRAWSRFAPGTRPEGPFAGGLAGVIGYETGSAFERVGRPGRDEFGLPDLIWGLYDWAITVDPAAGRSTLRVARIEDDSRLAEKRLAWCRGRLDAEPPARTSRGSRIVKVAGGEEVAGLPGWRSDFSRSCYEATVRSAVSAIDSGDVFQVNLSQRLTRAFDGDPLTLAAMLAEVDPAPHAGLAAFDDWAIVSASPERFLTVEHRDVLTQPIKGTTPLGVPDRDALARSEKDRAENVMIVDLMRNDLSRVCGPASVVVGDLCRLEEFGHVRHLVSDVRGRLRDECDVWDLLAASVPGGSISGAPKVRAMELIAEYEPTVRGPYCGHLFRLGFDGTFESNILIRTAVARGGTAAVSVGGGVTTASDPAEEYEETLAKAAGMARAFEEVAG